MILVLFGCTGDDLKERIASYSSTGLQVALECKNYDGIYEDISYLLGVTTQGIEFVSFNDKANGNQMCKVLISGLLSQALKRGVPVKWECALNNANQGLDYLSGLICDKVMADPSISSSLQ
jgi:hypothetical protein